MYLSQGCSSLFTYCTERLHLSEHEAYLRITAARLSRRFPLVLEKLENGAVNLTTLKLLRKVLTAENLATLLVAAEHKSKRQVEELVARVAPQPAVKASIRKLAAAPAATAATPVKPAAPATPVPASSSTLFLAPAVAPQLDETTDAPAVEGAVDL